MIQVSYQSHNINSKISMRREETVTGNTLELIKDQIKYKILILAKFYLITH